MGQQDKHTHWGLRLASLLTALVLSACGGGSGGDDATAQAEPQLLPQSASDVVATDAEAARFLTQATYGPHTEAIDELKQIGYSNWLNRQFASTSIDRHVDYVNRMGPPGCTVCDSQYINATMESFWLQALTGPDQLRQRMVLALSEIFVVSTVNSAVSDPVAHAAYLDMLADHAFGNFRDLLEAVTRHPTMGHYLSHIRNQKEDTNPKSSTFGRTPDENFAREVMQLFTIGLVELNDDGTPKQVNGAAKETYGPSDIAGLAKVFTGWSWACADLSNTCFGSGALGGVSDPERWTKPMVGYPQYHATEEKSFLGTTIAAQGTADPSASLKTALDALHNHPNVGPFIGRQLIQRFVTSNPSPAYVAAVASAFANNGAGVRGDMKSVLKAVLLHPEARTTSDRSGKVREPILRVSALLRAFGFASDSGRFRIGNTDNAGTSLGQTAMRSPSVFNFYRPGYVAPGTQAAAAGLVAPEMALAQETSAAGYVNYVRDGIASGFGASASVTVNGTTVTRRDLQPAFAGELALADKPAELVQRIADKLLPEGMPDALKTEIASAVDTIAIPALNSSGSNQAQIDAARRTRVNAAVFLAAVSPEFQVQK